MKGFDFNTLDTVGAADIPTEMTLRHPSTDMKLTYEDGDKELPVTISLLGLESSAARKLRRRFQARRLERLDKGKKMRLTPEQLDEERLDMYVALTQSWKGIDWKGEPLPCTPANVRMLYTERDWIQDQIAEYTGDLANYLGNSVDNSRGTPGTSSGSVSE